jgi:hypothetical protein
MRVRFERDLAEKTLIIQEEIGGQYALSIAFLEQIARRFRGVPEGVLRMGLLPRRELGTSLPRLQSVEKVKTGVELWNIQTLRRILAGV